MSHPTNYKLQSIEDYQSLYFWVGFTEKLVTKLKHELSVTPCFPGKPHVSKASVFNKYDKPTLEHKVGR